MTLRNDGTTPVARPLPAPHGLDARHSTSCSYQASTERRRPAGHDAHDLGAGDFFDVDGVATGYMNATMQVVDEQRDDARVAAVRRRRARARSSRRRACSCSRSLAFAIDLARRRSCVGLARRRLPRNRFVRGVLFAFAAASTVITIVDRRGDGARRAVRDRRRGSRRCSSRPRIAFVLGYLSPGRLERSARRRSRRLGHRPRRGRRGRACQRRVRAATTGERGAQVGRHTPVSRDVGGRARLGLARRARTTPASFTPAHTSPVSTRPRSTTPASSPPRSSTNRAAHDRSRVTAGSAARRPRRSPPNRAGTRGARPRCP